MNAQQWIAFGLVVLLIIFLIVAYFIDKRLEAHQWMILRFLSSLTSALAGWFISGAAIIEYIQTLGKSGKFAAQGTAGMGLFLLVWVTFGRLSNPKPDFAFSV